MYFYHNAFAFFTGRILTPQVKKEPTTSTESTTCVPTTKQCRKSTTRVPSSLYRTSTTLMPAIGKSALHVPTNLPAKSSACVSKLEASEDRPSLSSSYSTVGTHADRAEEDSAASSDGDISVKNGFPGSHALAGTSTDTIYSSDEVTNITKSKNTDNVKSNATSCSANGNNSAVASCSANGDDSGVKAADGRQGPCYAKGTVRKSTSSGKWTIVPTNVCRKSTTTVPTKKGVKFTKTAPSNLCRKSTTTALTNLHQKSTKTAPIYLCKKSTTTVPTKRKKSSAYVTRPRKLDSSSSSEPGAAVLTRPISSREVTTTQSDNAGSNTRKIAVGVTSSNTAAKTGVHDNDNNIARGRNHGDDARDIEASSDDDITKDPDFVLKDASRKGGIFKCPNCQYVAKLKYHLEQHIRVHHPFKCDSCYLMFSTRYSLQIHMRTHSGGKVKRKVWLRT